MTYHPVKIRQLLNERFEYAVTDGPTWERLRELKHQAAHERAESMFTVNADRGDASSLLFPPSNGNCFILVRGRIRSISGAIEDENAVLTIEFDPILASGTHPMPLEIIFWPHRRAGHMVDPVQRQLHVMDGEKTQL